MWSMAVLRRATPILRVITTLAERRIEACSGNRHVALAVYLMAQIGQVLKNLVTRFGGTVLPSV